MTSTIAAHDCPFCSLSAAEWAQLDEPCLVALRVGCREIRDIEAVLTTHRLYLTGTLSVNTRASMTRSLTAGEWKAEVIRRRMRVLLGHEDPPEPIDIWEV